jgi:hypothetical protein
VRKPKYPILEWIPTATTPIKPKKGFLVLKSYAPITNPSHRSNKLDRAYSADYFGSSRTVDFWMLVPEISEQEENP